MVLLAWGPKTHDDVIKWKCFPRYLPFVREIHRSPLKAPHKGQWGGALMFSLICAWINGWVKNREAGDLRRHYDVTVMISAHDTDPDFSEYSGSSARRVDQDLPVRFSGNSFNIVTMYYHTLKWCIYVQHPSPYDSILLQSAPNQTGAPFH